MVSLQSRTLLDISPLQTVEQLHSVSGERNLMPLSHVSCRGEAEVRREGVSERQPDLDFLGLAIK